jgi:hypothetical protein
MVFVYIYLLVPFLNVPQLFHLTDENMRTNEGMAQPVGTDPGSHTGCMSLCLHIPGEGVQGRNNGGRIQTAWHSN